MKREKPIITVAIPQYGGMEAQHKASKKLEEQLGDDYHVVIYPTWEKEIKFEVFYRKNYSRKEIDELKHSIVEEIRKLRKGEKDDSKN